MPKIQGRIIRILDTRTAIINLGTKDGINSSSVFHILGEPEAIIDPISKEELGEIIVVKSKLKAEQVHDKFTIATTKWNIETLNYPQSLRIFDYMSSVNILGAERKTETVDQGEMLVRKEDIKPWKAISESPVRVGDIVEVEVNTTTMVKVKASNKSTIEDKAAEGAEDSEKSDLGDTQ